MTREEFFEMVGATALAVAYFLFMPVLWVVLLCMSLAIN